MARKSLKNIIKIRQWEVEERQKEVAEINEMMDDLQNQVRAIDEAMEREKNADLSTVTLQDLSNSSHFILNSKRKKAVLLQHIDIVQKELDKAMEDLREAFKARKVIEIVEENRVQEERKEMNKKEVNRVDDMNLIKFVRDGDEELNKE